MRERDLALGEARKISSSSVIPAGSSAVSHFRRKPQAGVRCRNRKRSIAGQDFTYRRIDGIRETNVARGTVLHQDLRNLDTGNSRKLKQPLAVIRRLAGDDRQHPF